MDIELARDGEIPVGVQLGWALRARILGGHLAAGERLPGVRELAAATGVNINTVRSVYARLEVDGLIHAEHGRGTFVSDSAPVDERLADVFGAWAGGAVTNADLSFTTRFEAAKTPGRVQALHTIDKAIGIIASTQSVSVGEARRRLDQAGALAGVAPDKVARAVLQELSH